MIEIKNVKGHNSSVRKDGELIGRILSDGSYGQEPSDRVLYLSLDEISQIAFHCGETARQGGAA